MPTNIDPTYGGAVNAQGLTSLQNIGNVVKAADVAKAANVGTKFMGIDPASIIFSSFVNWMLGRGRDGPAAVETTPEMATQQLYDYLQSSEGQLPEGATEGRDVQYQGLYDRASELGMTDLAGMAAQSPYVTSYATPIEAIQGGVKDATTAVGKVIDTGLQQLGAFMGMGDPSLVVLNPVNPTASVVYGTPQGSTTPTIIGSMPRSGAPVGVVTGIPALDDILAGVFNQRGQGGKSLEEIIRGVVLDKVGEESGVPVAGVAGAIEGGLGGDFDKVVDSVRNVVLQVDKKIEEEDRVDPFSIIKGPAASEQIGPVVPKVPVVPEAPVVPVVPKVPVVPEAPVVPVVPKVPVVPEVPKVPVVPEVPKVPVVPPGGGVLEDFPPDIVEEVQTILGETPGNKITTVAPNVPVPTVATPLYGQGIRGMRTEKAGVTPIEDVFDISDLSLANVLSLLAGEGDNTQRAPYYGGGTVDSSVDEILRLLRG